MLLMLLVGLVGRMVLVRVGIFSGLSSSRVVQDVWDVYRDELGVVPAEVVLAPRGAVSRFSVDVFGLFGVGMLRRVYFGPILKLEVLLKLAALPFSAEVCYVFVAGVWEAELLAVRVLAACVGPVKVMRLMCIALSTLLMPLFLLYYSFVGVFSLWRMFSKVLGVKGLLSLGGLLFWVIGSLYVVMVRVVLSHPFVPGTIGFSRIYMVSFSGFLIPYGC